MESRDEVFEKLANFGLLKQASFSPVSSPQEMQKIASDLSNEDLASQLDRFYKQAEDATYQDNDQGESQNTGEAGTTETGDEETSAGDSDGGDGLSAEVEENDQGESQNSSDSDNEDVAKLAFNMGLQAQQIRNNLMGMYELEKEAASIKGAGKWMSGVGKRGKNKVTGGMSYIAAGAKNNPRTAMGSAVVGGAVLGAGAMYLGNKRMKKHARARPDMGAGRAEAEVQGIMANIKAKKAAQKAPVKKTRGQLLRQRANIAAKRTVPNKARGMANSVSSTGAAGLKEFKGWSPGLKGAAGLAAVGGVGAAAYGGKKLYDRHQMKKSAAVDTFETIGGLQKDKNLRNVLNEGLDRTVAKAKKGGQSLSTRATAAKKSGTKFISKNRGAATLAGLGAVGAAGYGAKKLYNRHQQKTASVNYFDDIIAE